MTGSSGLVHLAAVAGSLSLLTLYALLLVPTPEVAHRIEPEVRVNKGGLFRPPAQSEQASLAAGGHSTYFPGNHRCGASGVVSYSDWLHK